MPAPRSPVMTHRSDRCVVVWTQPKELLSSRRPQRCAVSGSVPRARARDGGGQLYQVRYQTQHSGARATWLGLTDHRAGWQSAACQAQTRSVLDSSSQLYDTGSYARQRSALIVSDVTAVEPYMDILLDNQRCCGSDCTGCILWSGGERRAHSRSRSCCSCTASRSSGTHGATN